MSEVNFWVEEALEGGFTDRALGYSIYTEVDTNVVRMRLVRDEVFDV